MNTFAFQHKGKDYEIRIISDGQSVSVEVFKDGKSANGIRYETSLETVYDAATVTGLDVVQDLIKTAKAEITKN